MTTTARARARQALIDEIKQAAHRQLEEHGASGISLRAVARDIGMVSSAVYRYFPSRDDLLTALIIDAYDAIGAAAEAAASDRRGHIKTRWIRLAHAIRSWAKEHPHDYALVYGSPVPGYRAPADTISPAARVSAVALELVRDGVESEQIIPFDNWPAARAVRFDLEDIRELLAPDVPDEVLSRALLLWTQLLGAISFELFGHLNNVIRDYDAFFEHQIRRSADLLATGKL